MCSIHFDLDHFANILQISLKDIIEAATKQMLKLLQRKLSLTLNRVF